MSNMPQVQTRFLLLSDTHARDPLSEKSKALAYRWPFPRADVAIHTGDLTMNGTIEQHERAVWLLQNLPADLKIVIPGNHDLTLDTASYAAKGEIWGPRPKYTADQLQYIRDLYTGTQAQKANIVYLEEGMSTLRLANGAQLTIYASAYTPEFCDWAFAYPREQDRFFHNIPAVGWASVPHDVNRDIKDSRSTSMDYDKNNIDVILTHGPPQGILDKVQRRRGMEEDIYAGCEHLFRAVSHARPLLHCFGHIHEGWGAVRKVWPEEVGSTTGSSPADVVTNCSSITVDHQKMVNDMGVFVDSTESQRGKETLFVNSSIMDVHYNPFQGPWIVDLMLDKAA